MSLESITGTIRDVATVRTVFGEPVQVDGVTLIPVARIGGVGGAGEGQGPHGSSADRSPDGGGGGSGGGFGVGTTPVGVYVVKDGNVSFVPAEDRIAMVGKAATVAIVALFAWSRVAKARQRRKAHQAKYRD